MLHKPKLALLIAILVCANAFAQNTKTVDLGRTSVTLSSDLVVALQNLGVSPGTIAPSRLRAGKVNFPVTRGAIDLRSLKGEIIHSGGLTLTAGKIDAAAANSVDLCRSISLEYRSAASMNEIARLHQVRAATQFRVADHSGARPVTSFRVLYGFGN